jgi:hypothetical protein
VPLDPLAAPDPVHRLAELLERQRLAEHEPRVHRPAREQVDGLAEAAQDGHRPGDGELVVVDPEGRDADRGLGRRYAEDEQPPAPVE